MARVLRVELDGGGSKKGSTLQIQSSSKTGKSTTIKNVPGPGSAQTAGSFTPTSKTLPGKPKVNKGRLPDPTPVLPGLDELIERVAETLDNPWVKIPLQALINHEPGILAAAKFFSSSPVAALDGLLATWEIVDEDETPIANILQQITVMVSNAEAGFWSYATRQFFLEEPQLALGNEGSITAREESFRRWMLEELEWRVGYLDKSWENLSTLEMALLLYSRVPEESNEGIFLRGYLSAVADTRIPADAERILKAAEEAGVDPVILGMVVQREWSTGGSRDWGIDFGLRYHLLGAQSYGEAQVQIDTAIEMFNKYPDRFSSLPSTMFNPDGSFDRRGVAWALHSDWELNTRVAATYLADLREQ